MANTENIEAKLCAYIDGDLDAQGRAEIEKHLAANPQHRTLIAQLSKQRDLLRELPRETAPEEILDALQSQMERSVLLGDDDAGEETAAAMKIHRWPQLMAAAAILVLTVGLGLVIYFVLPRGAGDTNFAVMTKQGAQLDDEAAVATTPESGSSVLGEATAMDATPAAPGRSSAAAAAAPAAPGGEVDRAPIAKSGEPPTAVADAARGELMEKSKAADDVFAPRAPVGSAITGAGAGELNIAPGELAGVQRQLQNEDLAKKLKSSAPGGISDNALFVVVSTADPSAARSEVTSYLQANKIAWDPVTLPSPELDVAQNQAVNLSRSQRINVRMKSGDAQQQQQQQLGQQQAGQQVQERQEQQAAPSPAQDALAQDARKFEGKSSSETAGTAGVSNSASSPGTGSASAGAQAPSAQAPPVPEGEQRAAESRVQSAAPSAPTQAPAAPNAARPGVADAKDFTQTPADITTNTIQPNQGLQAATQAVQEQIQQQKQLRVVGEPRTDGRLFVARSMTKQQVAELTGNLSKQTTVQRAAMYEPRPLAAGNRSREVSGFGGAGAPTTLPTTQPLALYKDVAAGPTTAPVTSADAGGGWRDGATDERQVAAKPTMQESTILADPTTAPTTRPETLSDAASGLALAATQPAAAEADERVDVVILVEDDAPLGAAPDVMDEEGVPNAALNPAPETPTTQPAAPASQPAP